MNEAQRATCAWLSKARNIQLEISELSQAKYNAWELATKTTTELSGMPGSVSKNPHKFEKFAELDGNLALLLDSKADALNELFRAINVVDDGKLRVLLISRYINCKQWDDVCLALGYDSITSDSGYVFRLHRKALDAVYEKNKEKILLSTVKYSKK